MGKKKGKGKKQEEGAQQSTSSESQVSSSSQLTQAPEQLPPPQHEPAKQESEFQQTGKKKKQKQPTPSSSETHQVGPSSSSAQVPEPRPEPVKQESELQQGGKKKKSKQQQQPELSQPTRQQEGGSSTHPPQQAAPFAWATQQTAPQQAVASQQVAPPQAWGKKPSPPPATCPPQQMGPPGFQPQGPPPQQMGPPGYQQPGPPPQQMGGRGRQQPNQRGQRGQQQQVPSPGYQPQGPPPQQMGPPGYQPQGPPPQQMGPPGYQPQGPPPQQMGPPGYQQPGPPPQQMGGRGRQQPNQKGQRGQQQGPSPGYQQPGQSPQHSRQGQQQGPSPGYQQPGQSPQHSRQGQQQAPQQQTSVTELTTQMQKLKSGPLVPMRIIKAVPGKKGRKIPIETNHLALSLGNLNVAYHYDVDLVPNTPKKFLRHVMELFRQKHYPQRYPAFDGRKNLYSTSRLPFGESVEGDITIHDSQDRDKVYKVKVKFANAVDLAPLKTGTAKETPTEALQVIDIVLRCAPAQNLLQVGRSFFHKPKGQILDLGEGMEMYHGFYQSAIRGWKPLLNVDVAHKPFPKAMPVIEALLEVINADRFRDQLSRNDLGKPLGPRDLEVFGKFMKQLRVTYEIPNLPSSKRSYRVNGINDPPAKKTFVDSNGATVTIQAYFEREKKCRLRYPWMPSLWVGSSARKDNPVLVPIELCTIEDNQTINRKMTEGQTRTMIKYSATSTSVRKGKIMDGIRQANFNTHPTVREFGFSVASEFEKLDARVLPPPNLGYNNPRATTPSKGVWRGDKFYNAVTIKKWTIVCADRRPPRSDELQNLAQALLREARNSGIQIVEAEQPYATIGSTALEIKKYFTSVKGRYDVIFVVVPNSGSQYNFVKTAAEINVGCLTQCIKARTVQRINPQTALNLLLKVNAKLNGTNHVLATRPPILNRPTMIMGADVTHPSPDSTHIPSVAAVTASYDPKAFKYNICWRLQPPRREIIDDLENIVHEQLLYFYKQNNGQKPERIVFFRDGVSDGQFEEVTSAEIRAIRAACKRLQREDYEPKITFLVVQKRHHTRLFPLNPRDSDDRNVNVPAGTCVDTHITHPFMQDFYLVSHASIQGVAKPTKYCTLWDDNEMNNDDIEELTYFLCHMFTRCNRSVSYPAPTYYAHLAAARGKVYIEQENLNLDNLNREYEKFKIQESIQKGLPMFFV